MNERREADAGGTDQPAASSPYSTGGGGNHFEHLVVASYFGALLTGDTAPEFGEGRSVVRVSLQQGPETLIDDIVLHTQLGKDTSDLARVDVAVRRAPSFVKSDAKTQKLVGDFIGQVLRLDDDDPRMLALVVSGTQSSSAQVAALAELAKGQTDATEFFELVQTPGKFGTERKRLVHLEGLVAAACTLLDASEVAARGGERGVLWRWLRRLVVVMPRSEDPDRSDWTAFVNRLRALFEDQDVAAAQRLADRLVVVADTGAPKAAALDRSSVGRLVHGWIPAEGMRRARGWELLRHLDDEARSAVQDSLPTALGTQQRTMLERAQVRAQIEQATAASRVVLVHGSSGTGKSALTIHGACIRGSNMDAERQFVTLNLRQLPTSTLDLTTALHTPLARLLADLTAPQRGVVIDAAEAVTEGWRDVFVHVVRAAITSDAHVVVITADENRGLVEAALTDADAPAERHVEVPPLTDGEIDDLVRRLPRLAQLAGDPRSRLLLRRLVTIDLLLRSGPAATPVAFSEVDVMRVVWSGLVRRNESSDRGEPDAREQTLVRLVRAHLAGASAEQVDAPLDPAALAGLRRDGLLRPHSTNVWIELPEFAHDEVRRFAAARALASAASMTDALLECAYPRWALPAARLACQARLESASRPADAVEDRLLRMQQQFDELVAAGAPARWGDVPCEALVEVHDPVELLRAGWDEFTRDDQAGLRRLCRIVTHRQQMSLPTPFVVADGVIERMTREPGAWDTKHVSEVVLGWLRSLVLVDRPEGHPLRMRLRSQLVEACDASIVESERLQQRLDAERAERLAARTPEQIARDEQRRAEREAMLPLVEIGYPRSDDGPVRRQLPRIWQSEEVLETFALLGPDLGEEGARVIEASAADSPSDMAPLVESLLAGRALASYDPDLLLRLTQAYYLDDEPRYFGTLEDGVRDHTYLGAGIPFAARWRGPFLSLFQTRFVAGAAMLNRILDHAAKIQVADDHADLLGDEDRDATTAVDVVLNGSTRSFVGDARTWCWYRGTSVGPYAMVSALQALEQVADWQIERGASVPQVVRVLLDGCNNLAMLGLAVGIMVRHADADVDWLDEYFASPPLWRLEFPRAQHEQLSFRLNRDDAVHNDERRAWSLREAAMWLCIHSTGERLTSLERVGARLVDNALAEVGDGDDIHVAHAKGWASMLDRANYSVEEHDGQIVVSAQPPEDVGSQLQQERRELEPFHQSVQLGNKYAIREFGSAVEHEASVEQVERDLEASREVMRHAMTEPAVTLEGPAGVAGVAIRAVVLDGRELSPDAAQNVVEILRAVLGTVRASPDPDFEGSLFDMGPDRSIARAVPLLLLPEASETFLPHIASDPDEAYAQVEAACEHMSRAPDLEVRLHFARGLDALWRAPCREGRCHHESAMRVIEEMPRNCVLGAWDQNRQRYVSQHLEGPLATALAAAAGEKILLNRLSGPIRALGAAAISTSCVHDRAHELLGTLLDAQRRAIRAHDRDIDDRGTHAMVAARALLQGCSAGREEELREHLSLLPAEGRHRSRFLRTLAAVAEETEALAQSAATIWPALIEYGIELVDAEPTDTQRDDRFDTPLLAALMPRRGDIGSYLHRELQAEAQVWSDPERWADAMAHWLERGVGDPHCVDALIGTMLKWDDARQVQVGLPWVHHLAADHIGVMAKRSWILSGWLLDMRVEAQKSAVHAAMWQSLVDAMVVEGVSRLAPYS